MAEIAGASTAAPGTALGQDGDGLLIATGAGVLRVLRLQKPGGRMLPAAEFLRGSPVVSGTVFASRPMAELAELAENLEKRKLGKAKI